jgi:hypothetical protein
MSERFMSEFSSHSKRLSFRATSQDTTSDTVGTKSMVSIFSRKDDVEIISTPESIEKIIGMGLEEYEF